MGNMPKKRKDDLEERPYAIYARLSRAVDGNLEKVESQIELCEKYAADRGVPVDSGLIFYDNSLSAWKRGVKRPAWDGLMEAAEAGRIAGIIVWAVDRFTRRPEDLEKLINLAWDHALAIEGPRSGRLDLTTASGKQQARWMALQAASESDNTSERVRATFDRKMRGGKPIGGHLYGFASNGQDQIPEEVAIVRDLAGRLLKGESLAALADWLNGNGHLTTRGGPWAGPKLGRTLRNKRYGGLIEYNGEVVGKIRNADGSEQQPVLDQETFGQVQALLTSRRRGRRPTGGWVLTGIPECSDCRKPMTGGHIRGTRVYKCNPTMGGCGRGVYADTVEAMLDEFMPKLMSDPENAQTIIAETAQLADARNDLESTLEDIDKQLVEIEVKRRVGEIIQAAYDAVQPRLMDRRRKIQAELESLPKKRKDEYDPAADWRDPAMTDERKRMLIRDYGVKIVIKPFAGNRSEDRVVITAR